jgi:hypothetical protein
MPDFDAFKNMTSTPTLPRIESVVVGELKKVTIMALDWYYMKLRNIHLAGSNIVAAYNGE